MVIQVAMVVLMVATVPVVMVPVAMVMVVQVTATTVVVIPAILLMICLVVLEASAVLTMGRDSPANITVRMLPITLLLLTTSTIGVFRKL